MQMTVLGGGGAWPTPERACSGYLVEHDRFRLLVDPGHSTMPRLLTHIGADDVDAVLVSHGHADHCADLNPLLRARHLSERPPPALPVYALAGAVDAVLALDGPMLADDWDTRELEPGRDLTIGPFGVAVRELPHFLPNVGIRLSAGRASLAYTGDSGPSPGVVALAEGVDVFLAEATFPEDVPADSAENLSSARRAGQQAAAAEVGRLVLTHLWPGTDPAAAVAAARRAFSGRVEVAVPGLVVELP